MSLMRRLYRCEECRKPFLSKLALRGHRSAHKLEEEP